ncbi:MAG: polyamine aminopropyltransferase [Deltaproteobacteria bacterium]|nr:polyamine aminopropyltransferase [Deltaproteobacteria bacterium]
MVDDARIRRRHGLLLGSVFAVAICGLCYELIAGALSSYLVGSSVTQFSIVIGLFMFAMGVGSFLARYVRRDPLTVFVAVEIAVGAVGGGAALGLFYAFTFLASYLPYLVLSTLAVGTLVGLEIPLVVRVLRDRDAFGEAVSSVLALDYVGALLASILFPLLLAPYLGLVRSGFLCGLLNVGVAGLALWLLRAEIAWRRPLDLAALLAAVALLAGLVTAGGLTRFAEDRLYQDEIVLARETPYQRIVVTRWRDDVRLYLNGQLQFSTVDEARYHEPLVHVALAAVPGARRVLILGGGDGMAAREVLKHQSVERIDLVDLDPEMTSLFGRHPLLSELNGGSLRDPRLTVHNADAGKFLERSGATWDAAIVALPDPSSAALARLYSTSFYRLLLRHLAADGALVTQATSPFYAPDAFWCVVETIEQTGRQDAPGLTVLPFHANVPSFGEWGWVLATRRTLDVGHLRLDVPTRFLTAATLPALFAFPADLQRRSVDVNRLDQPVITRYYERGWRTYNN